MFAQNTRVLTYLWQGAIVPDVAVVGEHVGHIAQFALLGVLFDRVQTLGGGDLWTRRTVSRASEAEREGWCGFESQESTAGLRLRIVSFFLVESIFFTSFYLQMLCP